MTKAVATFISVNSAPSPNCSTTCIRAQAGAGWLVRGHTAPAPAPHPDPGSDPSPSWPGQCRQASPSLGSHFPATAHCPAADPPSPLGRRAYLEDCLRQPAAPSLSRWLQQGGDEGKSLTCLPGGVVVCVTGQKLRSGQPLCSVLAQRANAWAGRGPARTARTDVAVLLAPDNVVSLAVLLQALHSSTLLTSARQHLVGVGMADQAMPRTHNKPGSYLQVLRRLHAGQELLAAVCSAFSASPARPAAGIQEYALQSANWRSPRAPQSRASSPPPPPPSRPARSSARPPVMGRQ